MNALVRFALVAAIVTLLSDVVSAPRLTEAFSEARSNVIAEFGTDVIGPQQSRCAEDTAHTDCHIPAILPRLDANAPDIAPDVGPLGNHPRLATADLGRNLPPPRS